MSHEKEECLRALADFINSISGGWWFRVPVLFKTGGETVPVPSDKYLPCFGSPLGLSTETLVEGLICLDFLTLTKSECNNVLDYLWNELRERWEPQTDEEALEYRGCIISEIAVRQAKQELQDWLGADFFTLEGYAIESKNLTVALKVRRLSQVDKDALLEEKAKMAAAMKESRQRRDRLKAILKARKSTLREIKKKDKNSKKTGADRRLRAKIEEDVLTPLGVESSSHHGGALNGNAIRRLMEHAEGIEIGIKQHLDGCCIAGRETEIEELTKNFRVVLVLLDAIYSLLLTKYGMVTPEILKDLAELLELLRWQWVKMGLPMTPKFHALLRHALRQLRATGGGLCDLGEDGIERSHQERLKDNRRMTGLRDFARRTNSQAKMQFIRSMDAIKSLQREVHEESKRSLKRSKGLADTHAEEEKKERTAKRARGTDDARNDPRTGPIDNARERNLKDAAEGKELSRAKH
jgi:hypothetical protein